MAQQDFNLNTTTDPEVDRILKNIPVDLDAGDIATLTLGAFSKSKTVPVGKKIIGDIQVSLLIVDA